MRVVLATINWFISALDRLSVAQPDRPFGEARYIRIVRHKHQRGPGAAIQFEHDLDDSAARLGVEIAGRLVGEKNLGPIDKSAGQRDALLFAAGKLGRIMIDALGQPDPLEQIQPELRARFDRRAVPSARSRSPARSGSG